MTDNRHYMACLNLEGRSVLVVGGGPVALEKVHGLLHAGARITIVAPQIVPELRALGLELIDRRYRTSDLDGRFLVVAATADRAVDTRIYEDAEARSIFCNAVDTPDLCSLILPSVHRDGPIALAVSTGGASPALAKHIRSELAGHLRPEYPRIAQQLRSLRPWARRNLGSYEERREYFEGVLERALR